MTDFELAEPCDLNEALELLGDADSGIRPMGGGTALMLMMKARFLEPVRLVSLRRIGAPLTGIEFDHHAGVARIGAMTTFTQLERSPEVCSHLPAIAGAMRNLANVRVRNVATVGGNLAHGDPHLDLPPIWAALGAEATVVSKAGSRVVAVEDIAQGYYETCIGDGEIISRIDVPLRPDWRSTYVKVTTRAIHDWPALGLAISLRLDAEHIADCRIVLSAATDRPTRLRATEDVLRGQEPGRNLLAGAGEAAVSEAGIQSDSRGSSDYKNHLLRIHLARAVAALAGDGSEGASHAVG